MYVMIMTLYMYDCTGIKCHDHVYVDVNVFHNSTISCFFTNLFRFVAPCFFFSGLDRVPSRSLFVTADMGLVSISCIEFFLRGPPNGNPSLGVLNNGSFCSNLQSVCRKSAIWGMLAMRFCGLSRRYLSFFGSFRDPMLETRLILPLGDCSRSPLSGRLPLLSWLRGFNNLPFTCE